MKQRDRNKINKGKFSPFCSFKANKARRRDEKFEYQREHASHLPDVKRKYYGFQSNYKIKRSNLFYRQL
jgi:hypothetical protein